MAGRLTNINLREWAIAPVERLTTQSTPQAMLVGEVLRLTPGAATYNAALVIGGLPSAQAINNTPYFHLLLFPWVTGASAVDTDFLTVTIDGVPVLPVPVGSDGGDVGAVTYRAIYRIPSTTSVIEIVSETNSVLTYAFALPRIPLDEYGQGVSLIAQDSWNHAAFVTIDGGTALLADGDGISCILPTATQLAGAAYYYLGIVADLDAVPGDPPVLLVYFNDGSVPADSYLFEADTNPIVRVSPNEQVNYQLLTADNNTTQPTLRRISAAFTTEIEIVARFDALATVCDLRYFWVIPVLPEAP